MQQSGGYLHIDQDKGLFRVARRAFVDQHVLAQEQQQIFDRCWLYLGHESEVPRPGDFVTRAIAGRNLIFNRDRNGVINAFYNTCTHRGAMVCREAKGSAKNFQCFYHGWVFSDEGKLVDQPGQDSYPKDFNASGAVNLARVERFENYRGLYFVCFDSNVVSLEAYLGKAREYIDLLMDQSEAGMEVIGGTQAYAIDANWKLLAENSVDGYHAMSTHATYMDYLVNAGALNRVGVGGKALSLGNGHAVIEYTAPWGRPIAVWAPSWGEAAKAEVAEIKAQLVARLGTERAERIASLSRNLLIFPNLIINDVMAITIRTFYPLAADRMTVNAWAVGPSGEKPEFRERRLFNFLEFLGPGGLATPDDVEALEMCQRGYNNLQAVPWNYISKGFGRNEAATDDELQMRVFWQHWNALMTTKIAAE